MGTVKIIVSSFMLCAFMFLQTTGSPGKSLWNRRKYKGKVTVFLYVRCYQTCLLCSYIKSDSISISVCIN